MLTIDEILRAHEDGLITEDELFAYLLPLLALVPPETIRARLRAVAREEAFEEWLAAVAAGAQLVSAGQRLRTEDLRTAIGRYRGATQTARYARLAHLMKRWRDEPHDGEPSLDPEDIAPFVANDIEPLLGEEAALA